MIIGSIYTPAFPISHVYLFSISDISFSDFKVLVIGNQIYLTVGNCLMMSGVFATSEMLSDNMLSLCIQLVFSSIKVQ